MTMIIHRSEEYLQHYSSPYYDPTKAHEYYEQHKQLKGRQPSLKTDAQKEAYAYVKKQITDERDANLESRQQRYKNDTAARKAEKDAEIKRHTEEMTRKIETLRSQLENMTPEQRRNKLSAINYRIGKLREDNNNEKVKLNNAYATDRAKLALSNAEDKQSIRDDAKNKLAAEREAIAGSSFTSTKASLSGKAYKDYTPEEKKQLRETVRNIVDKK